MPPRGKTERANCDSVLGFYKRRRRDVAGTHSAAARLTNWSSLGTDLVQLARDWAISAASPSACSHTVESDSIPSHMSHVNALLQYTPKSRP